MNNTAVVKFVTIIRPTLGAIVAINPLLGDMLSFLFTLEHDLELSVPNAFSWDAVSWMRHCATAPASSVSLRVALGSGGHAVKRPTLDQQSSWLDWDQADW